MKYTVTDKSGKSKALFDSLAAKDDEQALTWAKNCADYFGGIVFSSPISHEGGEVKYRSEKNYILDARAAESKRRKTKAHH